MVFCNCHISRMLEPGLKRLVVVIFSMVLVLFPGLLVAEDNTSSDSWEFEAALYGWLPEIDITSASGSEGAIDLSSILENLNFTLMGLLGAQKNRWLFVTDVIYLDLSDSAITTASTSDGTVAVDTDVDLKSWIATPMVGYRVVDHEKFTMAVVAGARYLYLKTSIDATSVNPFTLPQSINLSDSGDIWGAIVGVRGDINLTEKWHLPYHLDIGGGDNFNTWQGLVGVGYRINNFDIVAAYRYLDFDLDDNNVLGDLTVSGPLVGFRYFF